MSDISVSNKCIICGEWLFRSQILGRPHRCPPSWWCWISDPAYGYERDDGRTIYSQDAKDAATEFIARWDANGDYVCIGGDVIQVSVVRPGDPDSVQVFDVRGEMVPCYRAEAA